MAQTSFDSCLTVTDEHLSPIAALLFPHCDPFDRIIVAQAMTENIPVVSVDVAFDPSDPTRLWWASRM